MDYTRIIRHYDIASSDGAEKPYRGITFSQHDFVDTVKIKMWDEVVIIPMEIDGETKLEMRTKRG